MLSIAIENQHATRLHKLNHSWHLAHELAYASIHNGIHRYLFWTAVRDELQKSIEKEYGEFYRHQIAGRVQYNWHRHFK